MSVLVVDDNPLIRELLGALYDHAGVQSIAVASGEEALHACEEQLFELVVTDLNMPVMNGVELARELRRRYPGIHIYCHTGSGALVDPDSNDVFDKVFYKPSEHSRLIAESLKLFTANKR